MQDEIDQLRTNIADMKRNIGFDDELFDDLDDFDKKVSWQMFLQEKKNFSTLIKARENVWEKKNDFSAEFSLSSFHMIFFFAHRARPSKTSLRHTAMNRRLVLLFSASNVWVAVA